MSRGIRSRVFLAAIFVAFFASGAASLIAEVTWNRMLIVVVGNSLSATAMIVAVFMGGLGLGSFVGGRVFGRRRESLVPYLLLELAIGVYVMLSPTLFETLAGVFRAFADGLDDRSGLTVVRILVTAGALLVPAFLMGATFPAIISSAAPHDAKKRSARTAYLYSTNTIGAALGCFAAGYHLLFEFGVQITLNCALALYVLAALCALVAHRVAGWRPAAAAAAADGAAAAQGPGSGARETPDPGRLRCLFIATFGIGFVALAYEVLLTRISILFLGNSVSVFPLVLTSFLLGTGISAALGTGLHEFWRRRGAEGLRLFGAAALVAGLLVMAIPYVLLSDRVLGADRFARFADTVARNPLPILGIITAPTIFIGALLPVAIRMLRSGSRGDATRGAATLYSLNTVGGLLGAALANHWLVPHIGVHGAFVVLVSVCYAVAAFAWIAPGRSPVRWSIAVLAVAILAVLSAAAPPPMMELYARRIAESTGAESAEVRLVREGRAATVTVIDQDDPRLGTYRDMYLNGVEEASTRYWHTQLFKLLGILPPLLHEGDERPEAMVIAFGAGITAGSVLASDRVASLDVVDLNPDIEGINDLFTEVNGDVFHKPRFHFVNDDGRNYLVTCNKKYDLIIGDSTHPRAYDSWILYTEEFYRAARDRLEPGGILAQWVPVLGSMQGDLFRIHLNTFRRVFPNSTFWYVYGSDQAFLLATPEPLEIDSARLQRDLDALPEWFLADEYQLDTVERIAGFFWLDPTAMARLIGAETRINTDDLHYFDKQSAVRPAPPTGRLPVFQASALPYFTGIDEGQRVAIQREQIVARHLADFGFFESRPSLYEAYCTDPGNGNARYWMTLEFAGRRPGAEAFCASDEIRNHWAMVAQHPDNALALNALADLLGEAGHLEDAAPLAERAVALDPENGMILDTYGWILFQRGKTDAALEVLGKSAEHLPEHPIVLYHLGAVLRASGNEPEAREHLERALEASGDFPGADRARELLAAMR